MVKLNNIVEEFGEENFLSVREKQVIKLMCQGCSRLEIGKIMNIKNSTVIRHKHNIFQKTGAENGVELLSMIIRMGMDTE